LNYVYLLSDYVLFQILTPRYSLVDFISHSVVFFVYLYYFIYYFRLARLDFSSTLQTTLFIK